MKYNCCKVFFLFFKTELFIGVFVEDAKGFIDDCVCGSSTCRLLRQTTGKIF